MASTAANQIEIHSLQNSLFSGLESRVSGSNEGKN
jgi:hypothetical protein